MLYWIFLIFKNYQILKSKKCIPIVLFIVFCIIVVIIQKLHPGLLLITFLETFITVIMYFTIENPDVKLLTEVYKSKNVYKIRAKFATRLMQYNLPEIYDQNIKNATGTHDVDIGGIGRPFTKHPSIIFAMQAIKIMCIGKIAEFTFSGKRLHFFYGILVTALDSGSEGFQPGVIFDNGK